MDVRAMIGGGGFTRASPDLSEMDPLFFRGKTPVLGQEVEVKTTGELPAEFPAAAPAAPSPPGAAPTAPTPPVMPNFPEPPQPPELEFGLPPTPPGAMPDVGTPPARPGPNWWDQALAVAKGLGEAGSTIEKLSQLGQSPAMPWWDTSEQLFSLMGPEAANWFTGQEHLYSVAPEISGLPISEEWYGTGKDFNLGGVDTNIYSGLPGDVAPAAPGTAGAAWNVGGPGSMGPNTLGFNAGTMIPAIQTLLGAYGSATQDPGSLAHLTSITQTGSGLAGLAGAAGMLGPGLAAAGPALGALSLPFLAGSIYEQFFQNKDEARWPENFVMIPGAGPAGGGAGEMAINPSTGQMVMYQGNGQYVPAGIATPEQFIQAGILPQGPLLEQPAYYAAQTPVAQQALQAGSMAASPGYIPPDVLAQPAVYPLYQQVLGQAMGGGGESGQVGSFYTDIVPAAPTPAPKPGQPQPKPAAPKPPSQEVLMQAVNQAQAVADQTGQRQVVQLPGMKEPIILYPTPVFWATDVGEHGSGGAAG